MLVINAVFRLIYVFFLIFKYIDVLFKKLFRFEITKKDNDYFEIAKPHVNEVVYAVYFFYKQIFIYSFIIISCSILFGIIGITYSCTILRKFIIFLFFFIKYKSIYLFFNLFNSLKFNYFLLDFIFMFVILYYNYINNLVKKVDYLIKYQYELVTLINSEELKKKQSNELSPDLKVYYPMEYAMKSVMVRLTGVFLFIFLFIILIFEFMTIYLSPNLVFLFFPLFELKYIQIMRDFNLQTFYEFASASDYFKNNSKSFFYLLKCIIYLAYFIFNICILFFCYFFKLFFYFSWILLNDDNYINFKIMFFYNFSKNLILMFFIYHIYYTFFHTYIFINNFFIDSLTFLIICKQIIKFYLKKLIYYSKIILDDILDIFNTKSKPPLIS